MELKPIYESDRHIWFVTKHGFLCKFKTPFMVTPLKNLKPNLRINKGYLVSEVFWSSKSPMAYKVNGKLYAYSEFQIV